MKRRNQQGSVVVVAVAMLLLLSLLAVTYVTVMEIEVRSNEAFQYGMKADMIVNWFIADACALVQSSVRNVGIYEDESGQPVGVWQGADYADSDSYMANGASHDHVMWWNNPPHNWYCPTIFDMRKYDFDNYNTFFYDETGNSNALLYFGYISPGGRIFGDDDIWAWNNYISYDLDLTNMDGDYDPQTHRQARWRSYRNPDPDYPDDWDNIYARAAGLMLSTQQMLYLGEYRGDYTDRDTPAYVQGHERRMVRTGNRLQQNVRPIGYNLAAYKAGDGSGNDLVWHRNDHADDNTHDGEERVDRSKLYPSPFVEGIDVTTGDRRSIPGRFSGTANILDDGSTAPESWPDITMWNGGEGMMNINALIRILRHLVNERAAIAIAKHRPYRSKQQILQAVEMEGATLTTTEYARVMSNVTCHSNYDPITGFCPLNINKLRSPHSVNDQRYVSVDPLLQGPGAAFYDPEITNYLPVPGTLTNGSEYARHLMWAADYYPLHMIAHSNDTRGDDDPDTGVYSLSGAPGMRISNRLMWGVFSCIPSLVINHDTADDTPDAYGHKDYWTKMAAYAHREYDLVREFGDRVQGSVLQGVSDSFILQTVIGMFQNKTGSKMNPPDGNCGQGGGGATRYFTNLVHPAHMINYKTRGWTGASIGAGRALQNSSGNPGLWDMANDAEMDLSTLDRKNLGWSPVAQSGWNYSASTIRGYSRQIYGTFIEHMDRFEEMVAYLAPYHPLANPNGHGVLTERQANDVLNNFIDFRDNIQDPNNLLTDWKLHSQDYDRGNYEAYRYTASNRAHGINKDGYINDPIGNDNRVNTVCSQANGSHSPPRMTFEPVFDANYHSGVPTAHTDTVLPKVPYVYIREPYFDTLSYTGTGRESDTNTYYTIGGLLFSSGPEDLRKGDSVLPMTWNVSECSSLNTNLAFRLRLGFGQKEIINRLEYNDDQQYPWVNDLDRQDLNIIGIGNTAAANLNSGGRLDHVSWIRNYNWANFNWTKDWIAFNYHRNQHDPREFTNITFDYSNINSDFIAANDGGTTSPNPAYGTDTDPANDIDSDGDGTIDILVDDDGDPDSVTSFVYYESPGLIFGPDRIPDCYQSLTKGQIVTDLSPYNWTGYTLGASHSLPGTNPWPLFADILPDANHYAARRDGSSSYGNPTSVADWELADGAFWAARSNMFQSGADQYGGPYGDFNESINMDKNCQVLTHFGLRSMDHRHDGSNPRGALTRMNGYDYKHDSPYFHGSFGTNGYQSFDGNDSSYTTWAQLITLYNKPYLYDVPQKSLEKSDGVYSNVTFGYAYNYGRNVYAYDFDGSALSVKSARGGSTAWPDIDCPTAFKLEYISAGPPARYEMNPEMYGGKGMVTGTGGRWKFTSTGSIVSGGYDISTVAGDTSFSALPRFTQNDLIPRFNPVEPFFDPKYPNGRLFYRRLMACGDTTIVLNNYYANGPAYGSLNADLNDNYEPKTYGTWSRDNLYKTVGACNVKYEHFTATNPFLSDNVGSDTSGSVPSDGSFYQVTGFDTQCESWPVAGGNTNTGGGGSSGIDHWNHIYDRRYAIPWIVDDSSQPVGQTAHACADSPWSVPFCVRDRFYEIRVKAEVISAGLAADSDWRGVEILASKQAVAIFDRGWRWAYWDDRINEASPWYDPFRMVGSRPGVDMAHDTSPATSTNMLQNFESYLFDNEMYAVGDWSTSNNKYGVDVNRTGTAVLDNVNVGRLAPAEYSGVNRPGDDAAENARIVFFKWVGINQ